MAPIKHTCPDIDKCQKIIKSLMRDTEDLLRGENEYTATFAEDVDNGLYDLSNMLEDLRKSNEILREYGEEQEELAKEYLEKLEEQNSNFNNAPF
jgi:hypothetical protein